MIEARYHDSVNVLQELCQQDMALDAQLAGYPSPFDRAEWYALLVETGLTPLVAIASDEGYSAALALIESNGHITPLRNWYSFTWRQLAPSGAKGDRLLLEIARQLKTRAHRVTLEPVPEEDGSAKRLAAAFRGAGWLVRSEQCDVNHVMNTHGQSFEEYWADRPGRLRTTLKRKAKKVQTNILTNFDASTWADYERIYTESWKPSEDQPAMLRAFAKAEGAAGRLRLGTAYNQGEAVAAQCWTVENGVAYIHKLAHLENRNELSAGTTLSAALFKHVIDQDKVNLVDFGTGDQAYKADWMGETRARYRLDCLDPRQTKAWAPLAKRMIHRLAPGAWQS